LSSPRNDFGYQGILKRSGITYIYFFERKELKKKNVAETMMGNPAFQNGIDMPPKKFALKIHPQLTV
jgi:hypothetical protein